ncbi:putative Fe-S cluster-containing radical SAM superfamily protein [Parvibaculum indicum]|uniref:radical SAM protein n=1 Tax=Parvibaculum indicum TaxID=562969 RepID=UPI00141F9403|nr:radical SAM protein [Parvibaculum indicum]NIJ40905.1 putative Fe-S cluster-containing radical SAM superfamily protein [Parvibaculum indicum]
MTANPDDLPREKFAHPDVTAKGEARASVDFRRLETLWINTGTLCNIECAHCYIHSGPTEDRLAYITREEAARYLDEIDELGLGAVEIAFTGGEPFMNPDMCAMAEDALHRGHEVLILTNAMQPMMRPRVREGLLDLKSRFGQRLRLRISIDHHLEETHDRERGTGSYARTIAGLRWLAAHAFPLSIAARTAWGEAEEVMRAGFSSLFQKLGLNLDAHDPASLILFPEMDEAADVPEITTACWNILHVDPAQVMCATSRMVVKRKGAQEPSVIACTLLPDDPKFDFGPRLCDALGRVKLNHRHCATFCVLGGGSCTA